jgi:hypothetical protein
LAKRPSGSRANAGSNTSKTTAKAAQHLIHVTINFLSTPPAAENSNGHHPADEGTLEKARPP